MKRPAGSNTEQRVADLLLGLGQQLRPDWLSQGDGADLTAGAVGREDRRAAHESRLPMDVLCPVAVGGSAPQDRGKTKRRRRAGAAGIGIEQVAALVIDQQVVVHAELGRRPNFVAHLQP